MCEGRCRLSPAWVRWTLLMSVMVIKNTSKAADTELSVADIAILSPNSTSAAVDLTSFTSELLPTTFVPFPLTRALITAGSALPRLTSDLHQLTSDPPRLTFDPDQLVREWAAAILVSFMLELAVSHVSLLVADGEPCTRLARAVAVSPAFVSVSCHVRPAAERQLVALVGPTDAAAALATVAAAMRPGTRLLLIAGLGEVPPLAMANVHWFEARVAVAAGGATVLEAWTFPDDGGRPLVERRGRWTPAGGLRLEPRQHDGPRDFQGRTLRVALLHHPPYVVLDNSTGRPRLGGYLPAILDVLAAKLNFTPRLVQPPDGKFVVQLPNGSWGGIVGLLQQRRAELALVSLVMLEPRRHVIDFVGAIEWSFYGFMIRDPTLRLADAPINWRAYTEPFSAGLWAATAALLGGSVLLWAVMVAAEEPAPAASAPTAAEQPADAAWTVLGVLVQQGAAVVPATSSQRLLLGSLWILSVVLFASYTSKIVALLASTRYMMPFETVSQLAALPGWRVVVNPDSADKTNLLSVRELNWPDFSPVPAGLDRGVELLLTEDKMALFTAFVNVDHVLRRNCSLVWSPVRIQPMAGYMTAQRHLPYRSAIAARLAHLSEAGLLRQMWEREQRQAGTGSCGARQSSFNTMTLRQTMPALALLGVGMLAAVLTTALELCVARWRRRRRRRRPASASNTERLRKTVTSTDQLQKAVPSADRLHEAVPSADRLLTAVASAD